MTIRPTTFLLLATVLLGSIVLSGCRGWRSEKTPIHPNLNMDFTQRFEEQEANPFFDDRSAMRQPVEGTVARGYLRTTENAAYYYGLNQDGSYVETIQLAVNEDVLERGQERYNVYCTPCHGMAGDGAGIVMKGNGGQGYGYTPAPTYHDARLRGIEDGYMYNVITNGVRSMAGYAHQISPADRWAIVAYIRALQLSQYATPETVPEPIQERLATYNPNVTLSN
ncbi:MAG: cytochrome c [Bacteroidota bacterium]